MIFADKLFTGQMGLNKDDLFASPSSTARGHSYRVIKGKATKLCRINAFSNRIIDEWNSLPKEIVAASSTNAFKNALDRDLKYMDRVPLRCRGFFYCFSFVSEPL